MLHRNIDVGGDGINGSRGERRATIEGRAKVSEPR
jgi:hypothetical protein